MKAIKDKRIAEAKTCLKNCINFIKDMKNELDSKDEGTQYGAYVAGYYINDYILNKLKKDMAEHVKKYGDEKHELH